MPILAIVQLIVAGLPEIEQAVAALMALQSGATLTATQLQALGAALASAHARVQGKG